MVVVDPANRSADQVEDFVGAFEGLGGKVESFEPTPLQMINPDDQAALDDEQSHAVVRACDAGHHPCQNENWESKKQCRSSSAPRSKKSQKAPGALPKAAAPQRVRKYSFPSMSLEVGLVLRVPGTVMKAMGNSGYAPTWLPSTS